MTRFTKAAAVLATLLAGPAVAQDTCQSASGEWHKTGYNEAWYAQSKWWRLAAAVSIGNSADGVMTYWQAERGEEGGPDYSATIRCHGGECYIAKCTIEKRSPQVDTQERLKAELLRRQRERDAERRRRLKESSGPRKKTEPEPESRPDPVEEAQ